MKIRNLFIAILAASAFAFSGSLLAQEEYQQAPAEPDPIEVSDAQLDQFVAAQESIVGIQEDFSQRLEGVDDPEEAYELQVEANEEMTAAVEDSGLSVEEYNEIAMAIQTDEELRDRLSEKVE